MSWPTVIAADIALPGKGSIVSGPFGSNISAKFFVDDGVPVIRGNNITTGLERFVDNGFVFLSEQKAAEFSNCEAIEDDLIFTAAGTIGQVGIIPKQRRYEKYIISNKQLRLRCDKEKVDPLFAFYWFSSPMMVKYIVGRNTGSSIPLINLSVLKKLPIPLPQLAIQRKITSILSAYDDLIENNQRRIQLLEDSARLLYREWFVRLRFPGHEHTCIVDGVPEGWEQKKLSDVLTLHYGKALKESDRIEGPIPVFGSSGIVGAHNGALVKGPGIIVGRKGNVGSVYWSETDFFAIDTVYYVDSATSSFFLYGNLQNQNFQNSDGAVPGLNRNHAYSLPIVIPPKGLHDAYEEAVKPVYDQMCILKNQSQKLKQARDLLLPRLMSGEIPV